MFNGDKHSLFALFDQVLDNNLKRNVNVYYFNKICIEIINNFIKTLNILKINVIDILNVDELYEKLENLYTIEDYKKLLHDAIEKFTDFINEKKKNIDYARDFILDYIQKNYDKDIYLDLLADKLNISSNYLSAYFLKKMGVNFVDYLNSVRISRAKELLKISHKKVNDIALETGYNSVNSFIRAFKRYTGKTPNKFRNEIDILGSYMDISGSDLKS